MSRRDFLKRIIKSALALLGLSFLLSLIYIYPTKIKKKGMKLVHAFDEEELPRRGVKGVDFSYEYGNRTINTRAFIVVAKEGFIALSPVCSHLGCLVNWDRNKGEFLCPCHGGRYDMEGRVIGGPPPAPLTRLPLEIKEEKVFIGIRV